MINKTAFDVCENEKYSSLFKYIALHGWTTIKSYVTG